MSLLLLVLLLPLIGSAFLLFIPNWNYKLIRSIALNTSIITVLQVFSTFLNESAIRNDKSRKSRN